MKNTIGAALFAVGGAVAVLFPAVAQANSAVAKMTGPSGEDMGTVHFLQTPHGVLLSADLKGLTPGAHGFHLHEAGSCAPDFKSAGGHYNPAGKGHGYHTNEGHHAGDMPNIYANEDGAVRVDVLNGAVSLEDGAASSLFDADGSAVIIHAKGDSYGAKAGAGSRVACGVVTKQ